MDYPLNLAEQLRPQLQALRRRRGLTQAQLGQMIGVTQARVVEIEAQPGVVGLRQIMQVLQALGASLVMRDRAPPAEERPEGTRAAVAAPRIAPPAQKRAGRKLVEKLNEKATEKATEKVGREVGQRNARPGIGRDAGLKVRQGRW